MLLEARTFTTSKGSVESFFTDEEALQLCAKSNGTFARDLVHQQTLTRRPLSATQWAWVHKIAVEQQARQAAPKPVAVQLGDCSNILEIFRKAKQTLQFPKITFAIEGTPVVLSMAGDQAKFPGSINVASSRKYKEGVFYGRIMTTGEFQPTPAATDNIIVFLREFAVDPAKAARDLGRTVGCCIFCCIPLNDERSLHWGYGKKCSENWGLPWGVPRKEPV